MRPTIDAATLKLHAARTLAWAVLLAGWIGLGSLAQARSAESMPVFMVLAAWLLSLGAWTALLGRLRLGSAAARLLLVLAACAAAVALWPAWHGAEGARLLVGVAAFALVAALASTTVRAGRLSLNHRPGPPFGAAAAGAVLAWALVGDIGNPRALAWRLGVGVIGFALALALLHPARRLAAGARLGCRAAMFDCSMPHWAVADWASREQWPVVLASLVMLPMMCSLPLTASLCRASAIPMRAMLGVHLVAMFAATPLLHFAGLARPLRHVGWICGTLLCLGALAAISLAAPAAAVVLALAHGSAWNLAWAAQLNRRAPPALLHVASPPQAAAPLRRAVFNAVGALGLGWAVSLDGPTAAIVLQVVIGVSAGLALVASLGEALGLHRRVDRL